MGMCKCRKRTDLFCFVHKKAVCGDCIADHPTCVVGKYLEWLKNGEYELLACSLCSRVFLEADQDGSTTIRLPCRHVVHIQCLDQHAAALPNYTALAGYQCPSCSEPFIPAAAGGGKTDRLTHILVEYLREAPWAARFAGQLQADGAGESGALPASASMPAAASTAASAAGAPSSASSAAIAASSSSLSRKTARGTDLLSRSATLASPGGASRDDEDTDKYVRKKPVRSLLTALGIIQGPQASFINMRRLVFIFALVSFGVLLWVVAASSSDAVGADDVEAI